MNNLLLKGVVAAAMLAASPVLAEFPSDDRVTIVVPYSAGGGFDTIVRTFAPAVEIALGTTVIPENVPGASGTRGGQAVSRAAADGYTIGIYNIPGLNVAELVGRDLGFDLASVTWIANLAQSNYAIAVAGDSPIQSVQDLCNLGRPIKLSDTGTNSTSSITSVIAFDILGCPIVNVTGYGGSNDTMIAVLRGEVDATLKPISSLARYTDTGDLRLIATLTEETVAEGVQNAVELGHPELAQFGLSRAIGGPADMPAEIVAILSAAFRTAAESEDVIMWAESTGTELNWLSPEDTTAMMADISEFYLQYQDLLK
ncbi:MAG: hypothetical protein COA47_12710 [Robiginitomaculum sp.]|nr:MAG: hypothetical protein COA47_12710 [Robiginitomaculum sp.]